MVNLGDLFASIFPDTPEGFFAAKHLEFIFRQGRVRSSAVGADGTKRPAFRNRLGAEAELISRKVLDETYEFTRYRERLILRGHDRTPRQISIPTMRDRLTLRAACNSLKSIFPNAVPALPHAHIKKIVSQIQCAEGPQSFVRLDVQNFYPSVDHDILLDQLSNHNVPPFLRSLLSKAIKTSTGLDGKPNPKGIPQGLSISNILSAIYLADYDAKLGDNATRYVDDILIVCDPADASEIHSNEVGKLAKLGLTAHDLSKGGKTVIAPVEEGIDYLGYQLHPDKISIRANSYRRMFKNLLRVITKYKYEKNLDKFIFKLNLKITGCFIDGQRRGWLLFFSQTEDISQLKNLDRFVTQQLNRLGIRDEQAQIKRFTKAYYEIRYKGIDSTYLPNFDNFTQDEKLHFLSKIVGLSDKILAPLDELQISEYFRLYIGKEVQDLERDVIGAIS